MRHRKRRTRLGRQSAHRKQTLNSIAWHLLLHQRIKTTLAKAKEARRIAERLINIAREDSVTARRMAYSYLNDRSLVKYLFKEIAPLFKNRKSGFTRIIPLAFRRGDGASMVFLELTEQKVKEEKPKRAKKALPKKPEPPKEKERHETKSAPEIKPAQKEERVVEEVKKEKAKEEEKRVEKSKQFLRRLKGFFRRRTKM